MKCTAKQNARFGFTLLESLFAVMLIGLVIAAIAASSGAFTMANAFGVDLSTAEFLIEEIRELTANTPFADLTTLVGDHTWPNDNVTPAPTTAEIQAFSIYTQQVAVEYCGSEFGTDNGDFARITVTILKNDRPVSEASWIRANLD